MDWWAEPRVSLGRSKRHLQGWINGPTRVEEVWVRPIQARCCTLRTTTLPLRRLRRAPPKRERAEPTLFSPRPNLPVSAAAAAAAARTWRRSPAARDEHRHHRVGEAGVPGGGPEPALHQGRRQLLRARLPPPLHHLRRLRYRRLPLRDQAGDPRAVDGDGGPHRGHGRVYVRLPELRRPPHGFLPQRRRGRALQAQAVAASLPLSLIASATSFLISY